MANQTASGFTVANGELIVHGATLNYHFPYTGPAPVMPSDLAALTAKLDVLTVSPDSPGDALLILPDGSKWDTVNGADGALTVTVKGDTAS